MNLFEFQLKNLFEKNQYVELYKLIELTLSLGQLYLGTLILKDYINIVIG